MSKVIVAVTNIKHNNLKIAAGQPVPIEEFDKDSLLKLYELGAIAKVDAEDVGEEDHSITAEDLQAAGSNLEPPKTEEPVKVEPKVETKTAPAPAAKTEPKIETK